MYHNIGSKIKKLAVVLFWIGLVVSVIAGLVAFSESGIVGVITLITGCLLSWISNFFTYGFGELVENSGRQADLMAKLYDEQQKLTKQLSQEQE